MITLFTFLNYRFLISDKGSRDASFMDPSDLSPNSLSVAKLSELDFLLQLLSEQTKSFPFPSSSCCLESLSLKNN